MSDAATTPPELPPELPDDVGALKALISARDVRIAVLEEQLRLAVHKRFGSRSEAFNPDQLGLFNEAEEIAQSAPADTTDDTDITVPAHTRQKSGRKPLAAHLPRVRVEHDIPASDKMCPCGSGCERPRIGEVVTEQSDIIPAQVQVLQHVRFKYGPCRQCDGVFPEVAADTPLTPEAEVGATPAVDVQSAKTISEPRAVRADCSGASPNAIIVAALPPQPIPKSNASPGMCSYIVIAKYMDGLPLYRLETILARSGFDISRATMAAWMIRLGQLIVPLMNLMDEIQCGYDVLQMDETTVQVLKEAGRAAKSKSRMWVRRGGPPGQPIILFNYETTRSGAVAWRLLEDFRGYLQSDGYSGYIAVGSREGMVHLGCLAHARRKFDEALKARKAVGNGGLAAEGLALIQKIYRIEKVAREAKLTPDQRKQLREEKARPVWNELRQWLDAKRGQVPPQSLIGKALGYLDNQWAGLIRVLDDGRLEVDNNHCENAIRPFVMGRKAWLFSDTPAGATASARLYSLIETAKANGLEPYAYLKLVFTELPKATTLADVEALLPWNVARPATPSVAA